MVVVFDLDTARWLREEWDLTLDWDQGNIAKLRKHSTTIDQVETALDESFIFGGRIISSAGKSWDEDRYIIFAKSDRHLTIVWTRRGRKIRPISCRSMRENEIKKFERKKAEAASAR